MAMVLDESDTDWNDSEEEMFDSEDPANSLIEAQKDMVDPLQVAQNLSNDDNKNEPETIASSNPHPSLPKYLLQATHVDLPAFLLHHLLQYLRSLVYVNSPPRHPMYLSFPTAESQFHLLSMLALQSC